MQIIASANDISIVVRGRKALTEAVCRMKETAQKSGLEITQEKTQYMKSNKRKIQKL